MNRPAVTLISVIVLVLSLACGVVTTVPASVVGSTNTPTTPSKTPQDAPSATQPAKTIQTSTPLPELQILGDGCWNIRTGDGYAFPVVRVACGEWMTVGVVGKNGYVRVSDGWICAQAFGMSDECR